MNVGAQTIDEEIEYTIKTISGNVFELLQKDLPIDKNLYWLNISTLVCAIQDAYSDIQRAGSYHSKTGANIYKKAAFIGKWIAEAKPVQVAKTYPLNLTNSQHLNTLRLNAIFATFVVEAILGEQELYQKLRLDLRYIFTYRYRMGGDSIAMLLEHALKYSKEA